LFSI
jgi:hypothetical protein